MLFLGRYKMTRKEERIRRITLEKLTNKLSTKYAQLLRAQLSKKEEKIEKAKEELKHLIMIYVQVSVALGEKYFKWFSEIEGDNEITAEKIVTFFVNVNNQSEAIKFRKKWEKKIWKEINGPINKKRAVAEFEEFGEKNVCILHLVVSYLHYKIIKI